MKNPINNEHCAFECYLCGKRELFSFEEAYRRLWQSDYGWLSPLDWYRWGVSRHTGQSYVFKPAGGRAMRFAYLVHTRSGPVTIDDAEALINDGDELEDNAFISWAARFHRVFRKNLSEAQRLPQEFWPLKYLRVPSGVQGIMRPAYRINPGHSVFVIGGVDPEGPCRNTDIDWSLFQEEPRNVETQQ